MKTKKCFAEWKIVILVLREISNFGDLFIKQESGVVDDF